MSRDRPSVGSVETALDVVEYLRREGRTPLSAVAADLDAAKSTVYRHLATLEGRGYAVKDDEGYALSLKFLDIGEFTRSRKEAYQLAREKVDELAAETDERVQFLAEEHGRAVYIYRATGDHAVTADTYVGKRIPIHASAAGLAILSELPGERVDAIVDRHGLESLTDETIDSRSELHRELEHVRDRGYSINDQGYVEKLRAVGAPVTGPDGAVVGGLSISGPINRLQGELFEEELPSLVRGATNELELNITFR